MNKIVYLNIDQVYHLILVKIIIPYSYFSLHSIFIMWKIKKKKIA